MSSETCKSMTLVPLAVLVVWLLAGCGGGSPDSTDPGQPKVEAAQPSISPSEESADADSQKPAAAALRHKAKKTAAARGSRNTPDREGDKDTPVSSKKSADTVEAKLEDLVNGGSGKHVVSSQKEIRKILREMKAGADDGGGSSSAGSVEKTLEGVLGGD
jgi:hypothetical protein